MRSSFFAFFSFSICFDHLPCYLEPKMLRELTREPTGSVSFLSYTLFLIQKRHIDKSIIEIIRLFSWNFSCWSGLQASSHIFVFFDHSDFYFLFCRIHFYTPMVSNVTWNKKMHIRAGSENGAYVTKQSPHVRKWKTVLDSGLHAVDSGWIPLFVRETYTFLIPILRRISDSLSGIPYSKAQNFGFHKPNCSCFFGFQN